MARILEYQQDRLASSVVGTPGVDKSGQIIGQSVAELGNQVHQQAFAAAKQRQDILDTSKAAEAISQYETGLYENMVTGQDNPDFQKEPGRFEKSFKDGAKNVFTNLKLEQQSPEVQRLVNLKRLDLDMNYGKKVREWQRNQENFNASKALVGNITRTSNAVLDAARRGSLSSAVDLMRSLDTTAASSTSVLGPDEAFKLQLQANRDPRDALLSGLIESNPMMAAKILDDPQMDYKSHFTAAEIENKREVIKKAVVQFDEKQQVNALVTQLEQNQTLSKAVSEGRVPWKEIVTLPDTKFKQAMVDRMVASENTNLTESQKAFQTVQLVEKYNAIVAKSKSGRHSVEVLQDLTDLMTEVERATAMQMIPNKTALTWQTKIIKAITQDTVERSPWNKVTSLDIPGFSGLSETNAIGKSWEAIDAWGKQVGSSVPNLDAAKFHVFTRVADMLEPNKKYTDEQLQGMVTEAATSYVRAINPNMKMHTNANGAVTKNGFVPFRSGSSPAPVPGASVDKSARQPYKLKMSDGSEVRGYLDAKTGKYFDRPVGGVELK